MGSGISLEVSGHDPPLDDNALSAVCGGVIATTRSRNPVAGRRSRPQGRERSLTDAGVPWRWCLDEPEKAVAGFHNAASVGEHAAAVAYILKQPVISVALSGCVETVLAELIDAWLVMWCSLLMLRVSGHCGGGWWAVLRLALGSTGCVSLSSGPR